MAPFVPRCIVRRRDFPESMTNGAPVLASAVEGECL
jgi:hypothetical protein